MGDIAVSTIDAFCLSLLREYPLEADLDPGFSVADDAEVPRLIGEALDRALRTCRALAKDDEDVGLVFAQLGDRRVRLGLASLLERRLVAPAALGRSVAQGSPSWTVQTVADRGAASLAALMHSLPGGFEAFRSTGPRDRAFALLLLRLEEILAAASGGADAAAVQDAYVKARKYFLTQDGKPRARPANTQAEFACKEHWQHHKTLVTDHAAGLVRAYTGYRRDLNLLVSRGVWRMYRIAEREYRATLDAHALLDFADLLHYTLRLLGQMEEFSQSRYRLESRYQHVLLGRVPGHQPAAVGPGGAAHPILGRRPGPGPSGPARAVGVHRRRPQAVDLRLPRCRRVGAPRCRPLSLAPPSGDRRAAVDHPELPLGDRRCWRSSTTSVPTWTRRPSAPTRSPMAATMSSRWTRRRTAGRPTPGSA